MKRLQSILSLIVLLQACSFDEEPLPTNQVVVEAFLYAHEPVDDIHLYTTIPITGDSAIFPPINDALIKLTRGDESYSLVSTGSDGQYQYPGSDLDVTEGDVFELSIRYNQQVITATTIVPPKPQNVKINYDTVKIPPLVPGVITELAEIQLNITWDNPSGDLHFAVIENIERIDQLEFIIPQQFQPAR